jgi:hypothetical protein
MTGRGCQMNLAKRSELCLSVLKHIRTYLLACSLVVMLQPLHALGQQNSDLATPTVQDGQHDFDFSIGTWKTHLTRLQHPLTGSKIWIDYEGSSVVRRVWNGRADLEEFEAKGSAGHIEGLTLRLYNPQSHQWYQNWSSSDDGTVSQPMIGEFKNGRGEFFDQETLKGRAIYVRWVWSDITADSCRFEQSFSDDGGKTWELNWVNTYTRVGNGSDTAH